MGKDGGSFDFNFISSPSEAHCPAKDKNWVSWHIQYDLLCCSPVENDPAYNEWLNVSFCLNCLWLQIHWMFLLSCRIHWIFPLSCINIMALSFVFQNSSICPSDFSHWLWLVWVWHYLTLCWVSVCCPQSALSVDFFIFQPNLSLVFISTYFTFSFLVGLSF